MIKSYPLFVYMDSKKKTKDFKTNKGYMVSVCYVLSYYSPDYVRTLTLIEALANCKNLKLFQARNTSRSFFRYLETFYKLIRIRLLYNPDYYILGFRGFELFLPVRIITLGKKLMLDHMMSPYDSLKNEKKKIKSGSFTDHLLFYYEKWTLHHSYLVLTDTLSHQAYFSRLFSLPSRKIHALPVGADEKLFYPRRANKRRARKLLNILFYGSFLPLHGIDIILKAALLLVNEPINFLLIGGRKKDLISLHHMINHFNLNRIKHLAWVNYPDLPEYIQNADLILGGPFGNTGQAKRVITGKTFQALASAKPVIIGETDNDHYFQNKINCLLIPQGNPDALAENVMWAYTHQDQLRTIGENGRHLYEKAFSIKSITKEICGLFSS